MRFSPKLLWDPVSRIMVHAVSLTVIFGTCFLAAGDKFWEPLALTAGLSLVLAASAFASCLIRAPWRSFWIAAHMILVLVLLATALSYALYFLQPEYARGDAFRAVAQTDPGEALAFLTANVTSAQIAFVTVSLAAILLTFPWTRGRLKVGWAGMLLVIVATMVGGIGSVVGARQTVKPLAKLMRDYRTEMQEFRKTIQTRQLVPIEASSSLGEGAIILIQGESLSRHHMGLYGYFRDTTPKLSGRQDLAVFQDVTSPHSHTLEVLTQSLTAAGTDPKTEFSRAEDIVSLARAAGLKTYWFSNQNEFGIWDNPISTMAKTADVWRFFSTTAGRAYIRNIKDHHMLPSVEAALGERGPKLIVMHLYANHGPYCSVYPAEFGHFTDHFGKRLFGELPNPQKSLDTLEQDTNCYDDSVRYVDSMIDTVLQAGAGQRSPVAVLYQSDHGEAPMLGTSHDRAYHSAYHLEIPMLLWANEAYKARYPQLWAAALENRGKPYSTAKLFHSLAHLMQITSPVVDLKHSLFSSGYEATPRTALYGRITYDAWGENNDALENTRHFLAALKEKGELVSAHRVNTLGKLFEAKRYFTGIEMDVVFDPAVGEFLIYHPPAENTGFTLEGALRALRDRPTIRLWLDWKNAQPDLLDAAINRLRVLDRAYAIAGRALIETGSDSGFEGIGKISEAGFHHGYYLPTEEVSECLKSCSRGEQAALAARLKKTVEVHNFAAVAYDWKLRPFVQEWLDPFLESRSLRQYARHLSVTSAQPPTAAEELSDQMRRVPGLSGMLITFPSAFNI